MARGSSRTVACPGVNAWRSTTGAATSAASSGALRTAPVGPRADRRGHGRVMGTLILIASILDAPCRCYRWQATMATSRRLNGLAGRGQPAYRLLPAPDARDSTHFLAIVAMPL